MVNGVRKIILFRTKPLVPIDLTVKKNLNELLFLREALSFYVFFVFSGL